MRWTTRRKHEKELGDALIDAHHHTFFDMVRDLTTMEEKGGEADLTDLVGFLEDYVDMHFAAEEALMARVNFPQAEDHATVHRSFASRVSEVRARLGEPGRTQPRRVADHRQRWFLNIIDEDLKIRDWTQLFDGAAKTAGECLSSDTSFARRWRGSRVLPVIQESSPTQPSSPGS